MKVLGMRDQRKESEQGESMGPPKNSSEGISVGDEEGGQVGGHEREDQQGDEAGFPGELFAEPFGSNEKAANEEAEDSHGAGQCESGGEVEIDASDGAVGREKPDAEADRAVVKRDQGEGQEGPEYEGVGEAREWAFADDFGLAKHLPEEVPGALADGEEVKAGVFFRFEDFVEDHTEAAPEEIGRGEDHCGEDELLEKGEVLGFGKDGEIREHRRTELQPNDTRWAHGLSLGGGSGFPLEADAETVGVREVELLHAVMRDFGFVDVEALVAQMTVGRVDVGAPDVIAGIAMGGDAGWVRLVGALAVIDCSVEHDFRAVAVAEKTPTEFVGRANRRVASDLEAEHIAVEAHRGGHIEDLKKRANASHVDWHWILLS